MSDKEYLAFVERLNKGLDESYRRLIERKAALGQSIVISDGNGNPVIVPASEELLRLSE